MPTASSGKTPAMGLPVSREWIPVRSEDGILVVECSGSQGLRTPIVQHPTLAPTWTEDGKLEVALSNQSAGHDVP